MEEKSIVEIKELAKKFATRGDKWHFHILTPECQLNTQKNYSLVIENSTDQLSYVCISEAPYMDIGKELVQLLHGNDVIRQQEEKLDLPSSMVQKMLQNAQKLSAEGKFWHHHMLFPNCMFNKNKNLWTIIFEDQVNQQTIESTSYDEPKSDLKHIEALFYSQKK